VLGLPAPDVDLEEAGVAVAPLAVLLDPLGDGDAQVGHGDAGVGEAKLGVVDQDQVAGNAGACRVWPADPEYGTSGAVGD
jgi:hypothetical protein